MHRLSTGKTYVPYAYRLSYVGRHNKPWYRSFLREVGDAIRRMVIEPSWAS